MKILALETNIDKLKARLRGTNEHELFCVRFHGFIFVVKCIRKFFVTLLIVLTAIGLGYMGVPLEWVIGVAIFSWLLFVFQGLLTSFIDWRYDILLLTTEKIVVVNQSSVIHQDVREMNLENVASVSAQTQFLDVFPFGKVCFDLKEGTGQRFCLNYIPRAAEVTSKISQAMIDFQRRRMVESQRIAHKLEHGQSVDEDEPPPGNEPASSA